MASEEIVNILGGAQNVEQRRPGRARTAAAPLRHRDFGVKKREVGTKFRGAKLKTLYGQHLVFKTRAVNTLSQRLEYPKDQLLSIINVTGRTAQRREKQGTLSEDESDRLYRIARVTERAERVFGSEEKAHEWLKSESPVFRGATPLSLLGTDAGAEAVTDELGRIEFGDLF